MDMRAFMLNNAKALKLPLTNMPAFWEEYDTKSADADVCDIVFDYNKMVIGSIRLQGKKLSSFQDRQTNFNTEAAQRLDSLEAEGAAISKRLAKLEERNNVSSNQDVVLSLQCDRLQEYLTCFRGLEDIREQLQYSTLVLKELDRIFAFCNEKTGRFHRQLILKLRSAVKLNCDKFLFTDQQIDVLVEQAEKLKIPGLEKKQVLAALECLMDADLSPFPNLEDEDEAVSGHDGSN